jgi:hypothetical protein
VISLPKGTLVDVRWTERGPHRQGVRGLERIRQWLPPGGRVGDAAILSKQTEGAADEIEKLDRFEKGRTDQQRRI